MRLIILVFATYCKHERVRYVEQMSRLGRRQIHGGFLLLKKKKRERIFVYLNVERVITISFLFIKYHV